MDLYYTTSQEVAKLVTESYSTSFSLATKLCDRKVRQDIYNIYGLVRVADEIVDGYKGKDAKDLLDDFEERTYQAIRTGYSTDVVIQAFALTARKFGIEKDLIKPFFKSMRADLSKKSFSESEYNDYIYGSAEVIGLMCLKVFCPNTADYKKLSKGARAIGAAFQKINFLRDFSDDHNRLGRCYFPNTTYDNFDESSKNAIVSDIKKDIEQAKKAIDKLPSSARFAVLLAFRSYVSLLKKLERSSPEDIKQQRLRVNDFIKLMHFFRSWVPAKLSRD